jgi:hypothetical protein
MSELKMTNDKHMSPMEKIARDNGIKGNLIEWVTDPKNQKPLSSTQNRGGSVNLMRGRTISRDSVDARLNGLKIL